MKEIITIWLSVIAILLSSCINKCIENQQNAALKLYCRYADNDNLTVAYLSDFKIEQHAINAVMIQAKDSASWHWIQQEFSIAEHDDNYTVEMGMEWNTSLSVDEDIFQKEYLDNEEITYFAQAIVNQLYEAMNSLLASEGEVEKASFAINENVNLSDGIDFGLEFRDTTAVSRILETVANILSNNGLEYKDTVVETDVSIIQDTRQHGQEGYVAAVDDNNRTLWIFYYDNAEECSAIMSHIRKDIFVYSNKNN